jgi:hypothetical protein
MKKEIQVMSASTAPQQIADSTKNSIIEWQQRNQKYIIPEIIDPDHIDALVMEDKEYMSNYIRLKKKLEMLKLYHGIAHIQHDLEKWRPL